MKAGIDPSYIYAFKKTGLLVTTDNWDKLSPEDQEAWEAAISESEKVREHSESTQLVPIACLSPLPIKSKDKQQH